MNPKELTEFHKMEKKMMKKLNTGKKIKKVNFDHYFKKLDEIVDKEISLETNQKGG